MTAVAVLAASPAMCARLEALVAARPGWHLAATLHPAPPGLLPAGSAALETTDVVVMEAETRRPETLLAAPARPGAARPRSPVLADELAPGALARLPRAGVRAILSRGRLGSGNDSHDRGGGGRARRAAPVGAAPARERQRTTL